MTALSRVSQYATVSESLPTQVFPTVPFRYGCQGSWPGWRFLKVFSQVKRPGSSRTLDIKEEGRQRLLKELWESDERWVEGHCRQTLFTPGFCLRVRGEK